MELKKWQIIVGLITTLAVGLWFLNGQWNQSKAVAELKMCSTSNRKFILELELQRICYSYQRPYPCTTAGMADHDKARYEQYQRWLKEEQDRLDRQFRG